MIPVEHQVSDGPAERFRFEGAAGEVGFISAMSHHFCHTCNRLRLTASGQLRSCLLSDHQEDLKTPLRSGASDDALSAVFLNAARMKGAQHGLTCRYAGTGFGPDVIHRRIAGHAVTIPDLPFPPFKNFQIMIILMTLLCV